MKHNPNSRIVVTTRVIICINVMVTTLFHLLVMGHSGYRLDTILPSLVSLVWVTMMSAYALKRAETRGHSGLLLAIGTVPSLSILGGVLMLLYIVAVLAYGIVVNGEPALQLLRTFFDGFFAG